MDGWSDHFLRREHGYRQIQQSPWRQRHTPGRCLARPPLRHHPKPLSDLQSDFQTRKKPKPAKSFSFVVAIFRDAVVAQSQGSRASIKRRKANARSDRAGLKKVGVLTP